MPCILSLQWGGGALARIIGNTISVQRDLVASRTRNEASGVNFERGLARAYLRVLLSTAIVLIGIFPQESAAQVQQGPSNAPTIQVTSRLVFLDVTVLDKNGRPVITGLTKDDFIITEDKRPQAIFSFEGPQAHTVNGPAGNGYPDEKAPLTILVLDLLNSSFEDFAFIRYSARKFLAAQPPLLNSPAEMMVVGNESLEMVQGPTRNTQDLLYALDTWRL